MKRMKINGNCVLHVHGGIFAQMASESPLHDNLTQAASSQSQKRSISTDLRWRNPSLACFFTTLTAEGKGVGEKKNLEVCSACALAPRLRDSFPPLTATITHPSTRLPARPRPCLSRRQPAGPAHINRLWQRHALRCLSTSPAKMKKNPLMAAARAGCAGRQRVGSVPGPGPGLSARPPSRYLLMSCRSMGRGGVCS